MNAGIIVLLCLACSTLYAQKYNLKTEVLVYIMPDSLELPVHENGKFSLHRTNIKSPTLASTLTKAKVLGIAKAFPAWKDKDSIVTRYDGKLVQAPPFHRIFTLTFNSETEADSAITVLKKSAAVVFAEKHTEPTLDNDQFYMNGTQWYLNNDGRNGGIVGADIDAEGAWAIYTGSSSNKIAIIDTGVELTHEDLSGKVTGESPFGGANHGTMVAGVAAAKANNVFGIRGVDWNAQIISKNISDAYGNYIGDAAVSQKVIDAVNEGANVLNRSGSSPDYSSTLAMAFAYAYKMNRVSVATMGNTGIQQVRYPAALSNVIAVGATQNNDVISGFSTTGSHIDVVAPGGINPFPFNNGQDIYTTNIGNSYNFTSGTSFSAPQVTGLASLMKGYKPNLSNDDIRQIIRLSADDNIVPGHDPVYGYGRINAGRALSYLTNPYALVQNTASSGTIISTSSQYAAQFISATGLATANYLVKRIEVQKTVSLPGNLYNIVGAWGRGTFSTGWSAASLNYGEGFCEVVPGSLTSTSATLRTYVYQVWSIAGSYLGYYPTTPSNATFAYSVLGLEKPTISGPSTLCDQATYTVSNQPAQVAWSSTPSNAISHASSGNPLVVIRVGSGQVTLTAVVNGTSISKNIWLGAPATPADMTGIYNGQNFGSGGMYSMSVMGVGGDNLQYEWVVYGAQIIEGQGTDRITIFTETVYGDTPIYLNVSARAGNACGWSSYINRWGYVQSGAGGIYRISPNPTPEAGTVTIEQLSATDNATPEDWTLEVYDINQTLKQAKKVKGVRMTEINTSGWQKGVYFIRIKTGKKVETQKLVVQ